MRSRAYHELSVSPLCRILLQFLSRICNYSQKNDTLFALTCDEFRLYKELMFRIIAEAIVAPLKKRGWRATPHSAPIDCTTSENNLV